MYKRPSRREVLKGLVVGFGATGLMRWRIGSEPVHAETDVRAARESTLTRVSTTPKIVHIHHAQATTWSGQADYWNYVNQTAVNDMVDRGLTELTGAATVANAWRALIPAYQTGQRVAIKVNLNNTSACADADRQIDAVMAPVNAVIRGLKLIGVAEANITVYDATRPIPDRLVNASLFPGVHFVGANCATQATFQSQDVNADITYTPRPGIPNPPPKRVADVVIEADYLINIPIVKKHTLAGVSLGFKNHLGTINMTGELHDYLGLGRPYYRADASVLVDIYRNPHIQNKTVLTIADCLFAAKTYESGVPETWTTFGNQPPHSLLFGTDPVALDCVLYDLLAAEVSLPAGADDYLRVASASQLGVYEHGDPWGNGYQTIDYTRINLGTPTSVRLYRLGASVSRR